MLNGPFTTLRLPGPFARRRGPSNSALAFDPDAATYIEAVEAADEQTLEEGVKQAIDGFVTGCKADGVWDALKASCILAGARTLNGCLVPLRGDAPTNFNFVSADYDRVTGLKGDGSTKYLDSNIKDTDLPENSLSMAVYVTEFGTNSVGTRIGYTLTDRILTNTDHRVFFRSGGASGFQIAYDSPASTILGFNGLNRPSDILLESIIDDDFRTGSVGAAAYTDKNLQVFAHADGSNVRDDRLSFFHFGESLDLVLFRTRVSTLMAEIEAALT